MKVILGIVTLLWMYGVTDRITNLSIRLTKLEQEKSNQPEKDK